MVLLKAYNFCLYYPLALTSKLEIAMTNSLCVYACWGVYVCVPFKSLGFQLLDSCVKKLEVQLELNLGQRCNMVCYMIICFHCASVSVNCICEMFPMTTQLYLIIHRYIIHELHCGISVGAGGLVQWFGHLPCTKGHRFDSMIFFF